MVQDIPIDSGTIQGDTLSPFLFLRFQQLSDSLATGSIALMVEEQCILSTLEYGMCVAPYSKRQIARLDAARARVI